MFLSDADIIEAIRIGEVEIKPFERKNLQPASIDLKLGDDFLILDYHNGVGLIKFDEEQAYERKKGKIILPSKEFILGTTIEYIKISSNMTANLHGRSSIGRRGLFVQNAGWVAPGFEGNLTLELYNANKLPIELVPGMRICQISFAYTKTPAEYPYQGKYRGQIGATGSMSYKDE